jgi:hypothetical protein
MQITSHILMIRPVNFKFNAETAVNNAFQVPGDEEKAQQGALKEFDEFVHKLRENGVDVTVLEDSAEPHTPDSIFPNNWVSFHQDGTICLFPMYAANRRLERKSDILERIGAKFRINRKIDLTHYERENLFLEGTGSMVLDRENKIAYACFSPRTNKIVLADFCEKMGFSSVAFHAEDKNGLLIYHTNVMMCVADQYSVICLESVKNAEEKGMILNSIRDSGKTVMEITQDQMNHFAGNMLQLQNQRGDKLLVMSTQAYKSLTVQQKHQLESFNSILHTSLINIETNGGGSARCMIAEVFLPVKEIPPL